MKDIERFRGCLLAGAAGDALGYEVEFMKEKEIFSRFGEKGITEFCLHDGAARISDDTQMTLFTAAGLLYGATGEAFLDVPADWPENIRDAYLDWYRTQSGAFPVPVRQRHSWLMNVPGLFHARAPGNTCMNALSGGGRGTTKKPVNDSKGCGGVMRVAPVGLFFCDSRIPIEASDRIAAEAAAITHGHELGWLPAAALAHIVRRLAENRKESVLSAVRDALRTMPLLWPDAMHMEAFLRLTEKAVELAQSDCPDLEAIHQLGKGWVAEETLAIAVFCALRYPKDIRKALTASVNHEGDSDSTGAVTGNILGAALGETAIPRRFLDALELRGVIREIADDLCRGFTAPGSGEPSDRSWAEKYITMRYCPEDE